MRLLLLLGIATLCKSDDLITMGCIRDPTLAFCKAHAVKNRDAGSSEITDKDKIACAELRHEYVKVCALSGQHKIDEKEDEFCQAFENICFRIPKDEPDQSTVPTALMRELKPINAGDSEEEEDKTTTTREPERKKKKKKIDFTKFCKEFKNRYLFVCPDPLRFGQKAVIFCPIYSERCHVPLPDRPVVPTRKPPHGRRSNSVERICQSYRGFAERYCNNNPLSVFALSQPQYREGCEKYWRFCARRNG